MTVDATLSSQNHSFLDLDLAQPLSLSDESVGETLHVEGETALVGKELDVGTIDLDAASSLLLKVLIAAKRGEAPVLGDDDLLATGELVLGATEGLESVGAV